MTLILGIEDPDNNRAIIACDSGAWRGDQIDILREPKIWERNGWLFGLAGMWSHSLACRRIEIESCDPTNFQRQELLVQQWAVDAAEVIAGLNERTKKVDPEDRTVDSGIVVVHGTKVWQVSGSSAVSVWRGFEVEGSPSEYATGVTEGARAANPNIGALELADTAFSVVYGITRHIHPPFHWMATDGTRGELSKP